MARHPNGKAPDQPEPEESSPSPPPETPVTDQQSRPAEQPLNPETIERLSSFDRNSDGRITRSELRESIAEKNTALSNIPCDTMRVMVNPLESMSTGLTRRISEANPAQSAQLTAQLAQHMAHKFNSDFQSPEGRNVAPSGAVTAQPSDFRALAATIGQRIRACGLTEQDRILHDSAGETEIARTNTPPAPSRPASRNL